MNALTVLADNDAVTNGWDVLTLLILMGSLVVIFWLANRD